MSDPFMTVIVCLKLEDNDVEEKTDKMINDFTYEDDTDSKEFSNYFNFGVYLHYWKSGYENSVIPKYPTLKTELTDNQHARITAKQYYKLYEKCIKIYQNNAITAADIGVNNKKFKIEPGSLMTINHLISLKVYTDFNEVQNEFKKHCRQKRKNESLQSIVLRNSEIAHWCRYLKECCTFFGDTMRSNMIVYTGLNCKLMFDSMMQHFECPLSTTTTFSIANGFANGRGGIVLKLKAANPKTRYFNVSWLSTYENEEERLIMGSSLKIVDIYESCKSSNGYIQAIQMFEDIMNGHFIDENVKTEQRLVELLKFIIYDSTMLDKIPDSIHDSRSSDLQKFLADEEYDTDSLKYDTCENDEEQQSNITKRYDVKNMKFIAKYINDIIDKTPPKYILELFLNFISKAKTQNQLQSTWMNYTLLNKAIHKELKSLLIGNGMLFDHFCMDKYTIRCVQQYEWKIGNLKYKEFMQKKPRQYIESSRYGYHVDNHEITFHLRCYAKYSDASLKCALFLYLDPWPSTMKGISIELDLICNKKSKYRHLMPMQRLSETKPFCGFKTFPYNELKNNSFIDWIIGLKVCYVEYESTDLLVDYLSIYPINTSC